MIRPRRCVFESVNLSEEEVHELVEKLTPLESLSYSNQLDKYVTKHWVSHIGRLESGLYDAIRGREDAPDREDLVRQTNELIIGLISYIAELNKNLEVLYEVKKVIKRGF